MQRYPTQKLFFVSATVLAILAPWLLLLTISGQWGLQFSVASHSKSMLFGFVGALIAGYLAGKQRLSVLFLLYGFWLIGRVLETFFSYSLATSIAYSAYGIILAILVVPKFKAAKKWRNRTMMPLIAIIGGFPLASEILPKLAGDIQLSNNSFVLVISTLMFFMGGRLITPSLTRAYAESGIPIVHRVQPLLEGTILVLLFAAIFASLFSAPIKWIALPSIAASMLIFARLYRWQLNKVSIRYSSLWALTAGYIWLALGILVFSLTLIFRQPVQSSLHIITIGALGTLSSTVILRFCVTNSATNSRWYYLSVFFLAGAVMARYSKDLLPENTIGLLLTSAGLWSLNFSIILFGACQRIFLDKSYGNKREPIIREASIGRQ